MTAVTAVPLVVSNHRAHNEVVRWWNRRPVALSGHALIETYSVLTRLPGDTRPAAADAATLLAESFEAPLVLASSDAARLPELLAAKGIAGGAVYYAVIAMAALGNGLRPGHSRCPGHRHLPVDGRHGRNGGLTSAGLNRHGEFVNVLPPGPVGGDVCGMKTPSPTS